MAMRRKPKLCWTSMSETGLVIRAHPSPWPGLKEAVVDTARPCLSIWTWPWLSSVTNDRGLAAAPARALVARGLPVAEKLGIGGHPAFRVVRAQVGDVHVVIGHAAAEAGGLYQASPESQQRHAQVPRLAATLARATRGASRAVGALLRR